MPAELLRALASLREAIFFVILVDKKGLKVVDIKEKGLYMCKLKIVPSNCKKVSH